MSTPDDADQHETCKCSEELDHDLYECLCDCAGRNMTESPR